MTSKYSTLASSLLLLVVASGPQAHAQAPGPSPSPQGKIAYIRFWDMLPPASGSFILRAASGGKQTPELAARPYEYSGYVEVPAGRTRFAVFKQSDANTPLRNLDLDLKPNTFFTILVGPRAGSSDNIEVIDDTITPDTPAGAVVIRNFFPGVRVSVAAGSRTLADNVGYGESRAIPGLGAAAVQLTLRTNLLDGTPSESGAELEFRRSPRATLLIIPDTYGRFRPRVTSDGVTD